MENQERFEKNLELARQAKEEQNSENAKMYYELAYNDNPENVEVQFYCAYYKAKDATSEEAISSIIQLNHTTQYAIPIIAQSTLIQLEKELFISQMLTALSEVLVHFYTSAIKLTDSKYLVASKNTIELLYSFSDAVEKEFPDSDNRNKIIASSLELALNAYAGIMNSAWGGSVLSDLGNPEIYVTKIKQYNPSYSEPEVLIKKQKEYTGISGLIMAIIDGLKEKFKKNK